MQKLDYIVFLGRFQPFHNGHEQTLNQALAQANQVLVICGSADKPRDIRNPWTVDERRHMILSSLPEADRERVHVYGVPDRTYNDQMWVADVVSTTEEKIIFDHIEKVPASTSFKNHQAMCRAVRYRTLESIKNKEITIGIIGHKKDHTSYYLDLFPNWKFIAQDGEYILNATDIRNLYFETGEVKNLWLPEAVANYMEEFKVHEAAHARAESPDYTRLKTEYKFSLIHKDSWNCDAVRKYGGPILTTVDAVIACQGHVLLVKRRAQPGVGLWAFPGGYLNENETLKQSMFRELREETKLKVPIPVLDGHIREQKVFDDPERSIRGRIVTHAFFMELPPDRETGKLPRVKGADDAEKAQWIPIHEFLNMRDQMFEDHYAIGTYFLGG